jgi:hypothetical protein
VGEEDGEEVGFIRTAVPSIRVLILWRSVFEVKLILSAVKPWKFSR